MALNIKNEEVEKLLEEVVALTGETKTEAVRMALAERRQRLAIRYIGLNSKERLLAFMEDEIWSQIPDDLLGTSITKEEEESILGYGEHGV